MMSVGLNQRDGWFTRFTPGYVSHFWYVVEYCSSASDVPHEIINGYDLGSIVQTINELVNSSRQYSILTRAELNTKKFNAFICYCLKYVIRCCVVTDQLFIVSIAYSIRSNLIQRQILTYKHNSLCQHTQCATSQNTQLSDIANDVGDALLPEVHTDLVQVL